MCVNHTPVVILLNSILPRSTEQLVFIEGTKVGRGGEKRTRFKVRRPGFKPSLLCPHGLQPSRLLSPWDFLGKNTGVGCHSFSRGSSSPRDRTHVSCIGKWILYYLSHQESPTTRAKKTSGPWLLYLFLIYNTSIQ